MGWERNRTGQDTNSREDWRVGRRVGPARRALIRWRARLRLRLRRVLPEPFSARRLMMMSTTTLKRTGGGSSRGVELAMSRIA